MARPGPVEVELIDRVEVAPQSGVSTGHFLRHSKQRNCDHRRHEHQNNFSNSRSGIGPGENQQVKSQMGSEPKELAFGFASSILPEANSTERKVTAPKKKEARVIGERKDRKSKEPRQSRPKKKPATTCCLFSGWSSWQAFFSGGFGGALLISGLFVPLLPAPLFSLERLPSSPCYSPPADGLTNPNASSFGSLPIWLFTC